MRKRLLALLLCLVMCLTALVGCAQTKNDKDKGAYITMYLTDEIYNFDPAYAYTNEEAESIVSLMFIRLFSLNSRGKLQYELAEEWDVKEDMKNKEYTMTITLRDTWWSDKTRVTADDVVFAWKRILNPENSFSCAALLFDVKNARAVKAGNCSIDDLGVVALNDNTLEISFERPIDYDAFLLNLTSLALAPLREDYVSKTDDWAKKPGTMVTSGAFKISKTMFDESTRVRYPDINGTNELGEPYTSALQRYEAKYSMLVLERNACYMRDPEDDDLAWDKSVKPYRIIIDCTKTDEQIWAAMQGGTTTSFDEDGDTYGTPNDIITVSGDIFYMGSIPVSLRTNPDVAKKADVTDALSTQVLYLNENALIKNKTTGEDIALFANKDVRLALSLALNRQSIANALVFAEAATALVPNGIYEQGTSGSFRKTGGSILATTADTAAAQSLLSSAGIKPSDYTFTVVANPNDDALMVMAQAAVDAWAALGFNVKLEKRGTILNNDFYKPIGNIPTDLCDELYLENLLNNDYAVIAIDYCAYTAEAYSMLAPFAADFSGMVDSNFNMIPHSTGYSNDEYNALFEAIFYLPYYNQITSADYASFVIYDNAEAFQTVLDGVGATYEKYGVDPNGDIKKAKATLLHEAEKILMADMPIIPVVFNQNATIGSKQLKNVESDLYVPYDFTLSSFKNYENYVADFEKLYTKKKLES